MIAVPRWARWTLSVAALIAAAFLAGQWKERQSIKAKSAEDRFENIETGNEIRSETDALDDDSLGRELDDRLRSSGE
ncbi:hypothetical protein KUV62_15660 [Salipiger bermudensis]|uniref:hypothetical protein n=1 Tax=Salipiger bermudensis TaxID=344736 RepID=UPI001C99BDE6|nr:hypothetical protein [Salipiger bermudensis]MBY6005362.1 hypothetical protein [Salipiger bermudensis]